MTIGRGGSYSRGMTIAALIREIINHYSQEFGRGVPKTKLLKLVYLVELFYTRRYGSRLTDAAWVYYLYGPYLHEYDEFLNDSQIEHKEIGCGDDKESTIYSIKSTYRNEGLPTDLKFLIKKVIHEYGKMELRDLLDYVYFETEPMMNAENRGETLDFSKIMPEEYYKVKPFTIDPKTKKTLKQQLRKRLEAVRGKRDT